MTNYCLMTLIQFGMIFTISFDVFYANESYALHPNAEFQVVIAKFICSSALHMMLCPHVGRSMTMMKYVNNHDKEFTNPKIVFLMTYASFWVNIFAEVINIYMLTYQHNVEHCIIHFVALEVIVEIPHILMGSMTNDMLKQRIFKHFHSLKITNHGRNNKFKDRGFLEKFGRVFYKIARGFYVVVIFYF
jgi:hypothetical protein